MSDEIVPTNNLSNYLAKIVVHIAWLLFFDSKYKRRWFVRIDFLDAKIQNQEKTQSRLFVKVFKQLPSGIGSDRALLF